MKPATKPQLNVVPVAAPRAAPSPARQALADHFARLCELEAKSTEFAAPLENLRCADTLLAEAKAELEALTVTAADLMREWASRGGEGEAPGVLPDQRRAAAERIADRQAQADAAHRAAYAIQQLMEANTRAYGAELAKHGDFKADVVREIAAELGRQFQAERMRAPALKARIQEFAFRVALDPPGFKLDRLQAAKLSNDVGATIAGYDDDLAEVRARAQVAWAKLWSDLDHDPTAMLCDE